jgi:hypothetical protein
MNLQRLHQPQNPLARAQQGYSGAGSAFSSAISQKNAEAAAAPPPKTVGGGIMNAAGGATTAASLGSALTSAGATQAGAMVGGPAGMAVGAGLSALGYFLS